MPEIEVVVFDFGGVLAHLSQPEIRAELERALELEEGQLSALMYTHPRWDAVASGQMTETEYWASLATHLRRSPAETRDFLRRMWDPQGEIPEVVALARALHGRVRLAVLSNWTVTLESHMAAMGIDDLFEIIINSARVGSRKPDEVIFRHALDCLEVPPERILFIDDTLANVEAAQALGLNAILFTDGAQLRAELERRGLLPAEVA